MEFVSFCVMINACKILLRLLGLGFVEITSWLEHVLCDAVVVSIKTAISVRYLTSLEKLMQHPCCSGCCSDMLMKRLDFSCCVSIGSTFLEVQRFGMIQQANKWSRKWVSYY